MIEPFHFRLHACHQCSRHDGAGRCAAAEARDIREQAAAGTCPLSKFDGIEGDSEPAIPPAAAAPPVRADEATIARRQEICRGCPEVSLLMGALDRCAKCTCQLENKTLWKANACPVGKW